jgi:hypothetical protein
MPPDNERRPLAEAGSAAAAADHDTTSVTSSGPTFWYAEAEAHLREAGRRLEVLGLVDHEAARMALVVYRLASRVRTDRLAAAA